MALTRKMLKAFGIEDEKIEQIIEAHAETVDALKQQRDDAQAKADSVPELEKQLAAAKEAAEAAASDETGAKLKSVTEQFEAYKAEVAAKEAKEAARMLYREQLEAAGISGKHVNSIVKATDLAQFEVKDGAFASPEKVQEAIKAEWSDFIVTNTTVGADVAHPPASGGGALTKEQFAKMTLRERNDLYVSDRETYDAMVAEG